MIPSLETSMSSSVLLSVIFLQGVCGTFFPPVSNPPPIPGQAVRNVDTSPQQFFVQEDLQRELQEPLVREGLYSSDVKPDEQRWYIQESQPEDSSDVESSVETFDRFYSNGEPAIGPVATPIPDDTYLAQPSSISKVNPNDATNAASSDIWVLTRNSNNQYVPERWVQFQIPSDRLEVVNQESGPALATDVVKSVAPPVPVGVSAKSQFIAEAPPNAVQQVWIRSSDIAGSQKSFPSVATVVAELPSAKQAVVVPSVKQVVEVPPPSVKQVVQKQITKESLPAPPPPPLPPTAVVSKTQFSVPPPPPPPLKGGDFPPKVISTAPVNVLSTPNVYATNKNGLVQQVRHIWIPTSATTGKFITVPVSSSVDTGKSVAAKGIPLDPAPVAVSDTWVLKQEGPIPSFEQQKSALPPPVVQNGKVVIQDNPVFQVDAIPAPPVVAKYDSTKNTPVISKTIDANVPVDIWPPRNDVVGSKVYGKSPVVVAPELPPSPKTETVVYSKSFPIPPATPQKTFVVNPAPPQKTFVTSPKAGAFPALPLPPARSVQIINGKPCPIPSPPQKSSLFPTSNTPVLSLPRVIETGKQPLTRIIRVNRYPTGSYYLLNSRIRPSYFTYPSSSFIRQPKPRLVRLVQTKQIPTQVQSKPIIPMQTKQISIPVQSKVPAPIPARQVAFPFSGRQLIISTPQAKTQRIIYPGVQAIRYAYPWNAFLRSNPVLGKRVVTHQRSSLKKASKKKASKSVSSSSESSSSESSAESSKEEKKEGKKEEKEKIVEKPKSEEKTGSAEKEIETEKEEEPKSAEAKSEEKETEVESKESFETAESQVSETRENLAVLTDSSDVGRTTNKPYIFRYDNRDGNGTIQQRQEVSDAEGRVTGSYSYHDPEGVYRIAKYVADSEGFRVNFESNEPGTVTHESAHANFISNQATVTEEKSMYEVGDSTDSVTGSLRD